MVSLQVVFLILLCLSCSESCDGSYNLACTRKTTMAGRVCSRSNLKGQEQLAA